MAKTIARCTGYTSAGRQSETSRLGNHSAEGQANTYRTFTTCRVYADGSGYVLVQRNGVTLHKFEFGAEDA